MSSGKKSKTIFRAADSVDAAKIAPLIYESSHELLNFMFLNREQALAILEKLLKIPNGQFGYRFTTVMLVEQNIVGAELGYDHFELSKQDFPGVINLLRAMPVKRWPHLMGTVGRALSGYVPPPAEDAYYINNIAVDTSCRGQGLGKLLLDEVILNAKNAGYRCVELDVTAINSGAIKFYQRYGFFAISESGSADLMTKYGLPKLTRMRYLLNTPSGFSVDNYGNSNSTTVINDVTRLNPVQVDDVYAPGSVAQLQKFLRQNDKPISIGGGRFSMGGQTALADTLHIDMRGMNQILQIDANQRLIRVQAGTRWKDIQQVVRDYGLAVKIMQTYSNFTVGGSISVNCHGRYVGLGPLILSLRSISLVMHDGELRQASAEENADLFYAAVGGYGAIGIIVEAQLELAENTSIERLNRKMIIGEYQQFFIDSVRNNKQAVFHNADMIPPNFNKVRAVTWQATEKAVNTEQRGSGRKFYFLEKYLLWAITETFAGHWRREYIYEPLLYLRSKVVQRNVEADYDVAELEPLSRNKKTYVLQEYFVPVARLIEFAESMARVLKRFNVTLVNVSIRHAHPDSGSLLAWARQEVFAFVLYYKQGTSVSDRERVAVWTRELIDAVLKVDGAYYLPYQAHARYDQFHKAYPKAKLLFKTKNQYDPNYRFRNCLWEKYYQQSKDEALLHHKKITGSAFLTVYGNIKSRDEFYRFLQTIYHLYPEHLFHDLIIQSCNRFNNDAEIYAEVSNRLTGIKPFLSELSYALPALINQKKEMDRQTISILPAHKPIQGYLEIGSTGRYVKSLKKSLRVNGKIFLSNDTKPNNSPAEIMERGGISKAGRFFPLDDYAPVSKSTIADNSLDLVTCYIGLHHCPREKLNDYIDSIFRILRPGGHFILRDHDAGTGKMRAFCSLVHTVFNAGLGVDWEQDSRELRLFEGLKFWISTITARGFVDTGERRLQDNDPSMNTLVCFVKSLETSR